jgi:hypothetical protein
MRPSSRSRSATAHVSFFCLSHADALGAYAGVDANTRLSARTLFGRRSVGADRVCWTSNNPKTELCAQPDKCGFRELG